MPRARSEHTDNLILIAATTLVILTAQRYLQTIEPRSVRPAVTKDGDFARELSQHGRGRHARSPFSIP
jgi:membrane protein